ncbi:hypothetical protein BX667DRAFT_510165 [Coemansia mojavensis]|nr:hypothetical protein BX667DRAFT_510165 [Coemansia mojavensis]
MVAPYDLSTQTQKFKYFGKSSRMPDLYLPKYPLRLDTGMCWFPAILLHALGTLVCALGSSFSAIFAGTVMLGLAHAGFALFGMWKLNAKTAISSENKPPLAKRLLLAALELDIAGLLTLCSGFTKHHFPYFRLGYLKVVCWRLSYAKKQKISTLGMAGMSGAGNAEIAIVQVVLGIGGGIVVGCSGIGVQASVAVFDLPMAITLYGMVEFIGCIFGEAVSTSIWVNVLPTKLYLDPGIDIDQIINNITYYMSIPSDQQIIVQNRYIATQRLLIICGICSMSLAAIAILGLAPYSLNTAD